MKIEHLNATFQPAKIGHPHGLQVTYLKDNSTRNIFVYHEDGKVGARLSGGAGPPLSKQSLPGPGPPAVAAVGAGWARWGRGPRSPAPGPSEGGPPGRPPGLTSVGHPSVVSVCLAALWAVRTALF